MDHIQYYKSKKLLSDGKTNAKLAKNNLKTYGLSLIPHSLNTKKENLCKFSTVECRKSCLNMTGQGSFNSVQTARLNKADYFVNHKSDFINKLYGELSAINKKGKAAIRLNVISDVDWEGEMKKNGKSLGDFPNIIFYGYTKNSGLIDGNNLDNQHYTFSFSGYNWDKCEKFLKEKTANVAVVFKNDLPLNYKGFKVIDGMVSDERFLDEKGVIVGLKYKTPRGVPYTKNKFVIDE
jgi:hypothetical protein